ncbi:MAG: hypothetical protein VX438_05705 [Planctomycetota bacterium]|nr:hypothetical protein [Planctomycetota bacterium]
MSTIESEDWFGAFRETINGTSENWIPFDSYLWGTTDSITARNSTPFVDLFMQKVTSCPISIQESGLLVGFTHEPYLEKAMDCLATLNGMALFPEEFSAGQYLDSINSLIEQLTVDHQQLLLEDPITHQILLGEIPLTAGLRFPGLVESKQCMDAARINLASAIKEILDGDGLPSAKYLEQSKLLMACWTRCLLLCDLAGKECLDVDAQVQLELFFRQMIRLMRKDGTLVFSNDKNHMRELIQVAIGCCQDEDDINIAAAVFPRKKNGKTTKPILSSLPEPSVNSEWGEIAVLQTGWLPKLPKLTVSYRQRKLIAELSSGDVLLSGEIKNEFSFDNQNVSQSADWEVVCWHSDPDGDFLELECQLENGTKWQKHFLLAREDRFLLVGDVLLETNAGTIDYSSRWPLFRETGFGAAKETNEMFLTRKAKTVAGVLPIALPEWRVERHGSSMMVSDSQLNYQARTEGRNLYFPYFIDLNPRRCRKPLTWRQLTVADQRDVLPSSKAAAFRVHVGNQQWLIYRSLDKTASRTAFGQNLAVEFYVGTFEPDGTCQEIISVG